jgi:hypothetical protein
MPNGTIILGKPKAKYNFLLDILSFSISYIVRNLINLSFIFEFTSNSNVEKFGFLILFYSDSSYSKLMKPIFLIVFIWFNSFLNLVISSCYYDFIWKLIDSSSMNTEIDRSYFAIFLSLSSISIFRS